MTFFRGFLAFSLYLVIIFSFMQNHILLGLFAVVIYTFTFSAVLLIPLAILLDGYYGAFYTLPVFSLATILLYLLSEIIRVTLNIVQSEHE